MNQYIATKPVSLAAGVRVALTGQQARARAHALQPVQVDESRGGVYATTAAIQFKAGETFGTDMVLNKALATVLQPADDAAPAIRARKAAK
jgi:hypothetical protein